MAGGTSIRTVEGTPPAAGLRVALAVSKYNDFVTDRRAHPDGSFVSKLIDAGLTNAEVVGFCQLIGSAGTETLTKLLANAIVFRVALTLEVVP